MERFLVMVMVRPTGIVRLVKEVSLNRKETTDEIVLAR